ncbi:hypothetical protein PQ689_03395 [Thermoanaerobacterium thermosaccharolyticum]|uniref:hypothetical protein n=1 Tax=Thermoanaerobacterium thermosaccharolyticum TaxID=1517 RepID=UPI003DA97F3C
MRYHEDALKQFENILRQFNYQKDKDSNYDDLKKIFFSIYALNYIANRVELKNIFQSTYFKISFSCLLETFALILNNYPRAAALVLRSGLENFLKFIIESYKDKKYKINDKVYSENKKTLELIIKEKYDGKLKKECITINSRMETKYKNLSGVSHSLTPESINNIKKYFAELNDIESEIIKNVLEYFDIIIGDMFTFSLIISENSLKLWDSKELENIINLAFGSKRTKTLINIIKE